MTIGFFSMWKRCLEGEKEKQYDFKVEFTYVYYKLTMKKVRISFALKTAIE